MAAPQDGLRDARRAGPLLKIPANSVASAATRQFAAVLSQIRRKRAIQALALRCSERKVRLRESAHPPYASGEPPCQNSRKS